MYCRLDVISDVPGDKHELIRFAIFDTRNIENYQ